jgi:fermentation-respiration switch protein FrsA (DUF1100 family)
LPKRISFFSEGIEVAGVLYEPEPKGRGPLPGVVLCHGFTGIKEMIMPDIGQRFADAGILSLAFDYRHFGESGGKPRNHLLPLAQVRDIQNAITYMENLETVDAARIGLWGASFGGANVIYAGGIDRRAKAIVAVNPVGDGSRWMRSLRTPEAWYQLLAKVDADRSQRVATGAYDEIWAFEVLTPDSVTIPFVKERWGQLKLPRNITIESVEAILEYSPESVVAKIAPRALLILATPRDQVVPNEEAQSLVATAGEPKRLLWVIESLHHWAAYFEPAIERVAGESIGWFTKYLGEGPSGDAGVLAS